MDSDTVLSWVSAFGLAFLITFAGFLITSFAIYFLIKKVLKKQFHLASSEFLPPILISLGSGFFMSRNFFPFGWGSLPFLEKFFGIIGLIGFGRILEIFVLNLLDREKLGNHNLGRSTQTLLRVVLKFFVWLSIGLIVLDFLGITLTPILASLGVGSLAVALALQDTLGNLFSGFYILADRPFFIGDWIQTNGDPASLGKVEKIGWRSCELLTLQNNSIIIPNSKISSSMITNFSKPAADLTVSVECGVAYTSQLERVEATVIDEVKKLAQDRTDLLNQPESCQVRFEGFGDSAILFSIFLNAPSFAKRAQLQSEVIKRIHSRFKQENIEIPFPHRVVNILKEF